MGEKILLERYRGEFSNDVENAIDVAFSTKTRLLPNDNLNEEFSLLEQYNKERDKCDKFRVILNINPICSNILFNKKSEIVLNEGSDSCEVLLDDGGRGLSKETYAVSAQNTSNITYRHAIRDTEYTHKDCGNFVYHCGIDIFNNHMLRKTNFVHVNKYNTNSQNLSEKVYNTILDYYRDGRGEIVEENIGVKYTKTNKTKLHLYQYDTIMSMPSAFLDNCTERDGWWGFINPNTIEIANSENGDISINKMMANNKSCEFIDLYPDRSLFSFVPKYNKFRKRIEQNWDYCITYPYKKDLNKIDEICGGKQQAIRATMKFKINKSSVPTLECSSYFKHNLKPGDFVSFYYYLPHYNFVKDADEPLKAVYDKSDNSYKFYLETDVNGYDVVADDAIEYRRVYKDNMEFIRYNIKVKVQSIGDSNGLSSDRIFNVKYSDVETIYEHMKNFGCFYKKNSHGNDLSYYFRIFKKLKTINGDDLRSDVNKVGFGRNIYGDETAQIIFMDDINIENLKDHNNRPLTEVFLTIVKSNRGYQKWYANTPNFTDEDIEYSHCFGKVTSGIDFCGIDDEPFDYNVHYLHNISKSNAPTMSELNTLSAWGETILRGVPKVLEDEININKNEFYGDIVEFDTDAFTETTIGNVYHRFNTAQREIWNTNYKHIVRDEIVSDDYDNVNGDGKAFNVATYYLNNVTTSVDEKGVEKDVMFGNISPEGYFYNPHNKIEIREINDMVLKSDAKHINYSEYKFRKITTTLLFKADGTIKIYNDELDAMIAKEADDTIVTQGSYYEIDIKAPTNFGFLKGDYIAFYNKKTTETSWGEIVSVSGDMVTVRYDDSSFATIDNVTSQHFKPNSGQRCLYAFWSPDNVPVYAQLSLGTQKFVWKNIIPPSEMTNEDDLYDMPFANGRFYIENNINLFLKRQDPHGKYGLSLPLFKVYEPTLANPLLRFNVTGGEPIDMFDIIYQINNDLTSCV